MKKAINIKVILLLVAVFVVFRFGKLMMAKTGLLGSKNDQNDLLNKAETTIAGIAVDDRKTSKTAFELQQRADSCYQAFFGSPFMSMGTDEKMFFDALSGLNKEDLKGVVKYFGIRKASAFGGLVSVFSGDLFAWIQAELSGSELQRAKDIFKVTGLWS